MDKENIIGAESTETVAQTTKKQAGKKPSDTYIHEFEKPFEYEGKKYTSVNFYFGKLTGGDMLAIENEMQAENEYALDPILSRSFLSKMASIASNIPEDVIEAMPARDFTKITNAARNFLTD